MKWTKEKPKRDGWYWVDIRPHIDLPFGYFGVGIITILLNGEIHIRSNIFHGYIQDFDVLYSDKEIKSPKGLPRN